jgi:hypothetical protein
MTIISGRRVITTDAGVIAADDHRVTGTATTGFAMSLSSGGGSGNVTDGNTVGDVPVWDGDSYEPVAPTDPVAADIPYTPSGTIAATDVGAAIAEAASDATQKATLTTKGDIYVATGSATPIRVAVGSNDQVLTADSGQSSGVKWATPSGGGGGSTLALPDPTMFGYKTWAWDPATLTGAGEAPAAGIVEMVRLPWRGSATMSQITLMASELGGGGGFAGVYFGLYIKSGTNLVLIAKTSTDRVSALDYGVNFHTLTAESGQSLTVATDAVLYGAVLIVTQGSTTQKFYKTTVNGPNQNGAVTDGLYRTAKYSSGLTALPATIAVASMTSNTFLWWMAAN